MKTDNYTGAGTHNKLQKLDQDMNRAMKTDTPETDAKEIDISTSTIQIETRYVRADFAQNIERERNEARRLAQYWRSQSGRSMPSDKPFPWNVVKPTQITGT